MVIGFPTHGLVGSVAALYLVHALDMTNVAYMVSGEFPPTVIMEEGRGERPRPVLRLQGRLRRRPAVRTAGGRDFGHPAAPRDAEPPQPPLD